MARLLELEAHVPIFSFRQQAGFRFDRATETWILELRNAVYMLYPEWAMEQLETIFLSEQGWALEHPGDTMGIGGRGGRGPSSYAVTNEDLAAWSGRFVGEFQSTDQLYSKSPYIRYVAVERNEAGKVTAFDAHCGGLSNLRFVPEDRPK